MPFQRFSGKSEWNVRKIQYIEHMRNFTDDILLNWMLFFSFPPQCYTVIFLKISNGDAFLLKIHQQVTVVSSLCSVTIFQDSYRILSTHISYLSPICILHICRPLAIVTQVVLGLLTTLYHSLFGGFFFFFFGTSFNQ